MHNQWNDPYPPPPGMEDSIPRMNRSSQASHSPHIREETLTRSSFNDMQSPMNLNNYGNSAGTNTDYLLGANVNVSTQGLNAYNSQFQRPNANAFGRPPVGRENVQQRRDNDLQQHPPPGMQRRFNGHYRTNNAGLRYGVGNEDRDLSRDFAPPGMVPPTALSVRELEAGLTNGLQQSQTQNQRLSSLPVNFENIRRPLSASAADQSHAAGIRSKVEELWESQQPDYLQLSQLQLDGVEQLNQVDRSRSSRTFHEGNHNQVQQQSTRGSRFMQQPWFSANQNSNVKAGTDRSNGTDIFGSNGLNLAQEIDGIQHSKLQHDRNVNSSTMMRDRTGESANDQETLEGKEDEAFARRQEQKKMARTARFFWSPVGEISVKPGVTGPNQRIEVSWRIPISHVSVSSFNRRESEAVEVHDWIGLFRSRKRIDQSDGHILTREIKGQSNVVFDDRDNQKYAVGHISLRTPRGVGEYDFRYFKASDQELSHSKENHSFQNDEKDSEEAVEKVKMPLARSAPVIVEVQGAALFEAIEFVENNLDDEKRMANVTSQLATLIGQIKSLKRPLLQDIKGNGGRGRGRRGNNSRNNYQKRNFQSDKRAETRQENELAAFLCRIVFACMSKVEKRCLKLNDKIDSNAEKAAEKRENFKIIEEKRKKIVEAEQELDEEEFAKWKEAKNAMVLMDRTISGYKRECTSLSGALKAVIDETLSCEAVFQCLKIHERDVLIEAMQRFCPITGVFYSSLKDLEQFFTETMKIAFSKSDIDTNNPRSYNDSVIRGFRMVPNVRARRLSNSTLAKVSSSASRLLEQIYPPQDFHEQRFQFLNAVENAINDHVNWTCVAKLVPFGSSANNFGTVTSDLDICLVLLPQKAARGSHLLAIAEDARVENPPTAIEAVENLVEVLNDLPMEDVDDQRKTARIPIVKFRNPKLDLECDMCIDNRLAIRNTLLLRTYSEIDPRVRQIAYIVKAWAKVREINNPAMHTLPSYGYLLLIIQYLQVLTPHPVLPVLQELSVSWDGGLYWRKRACGETQVIVSGPDGKKCDTYFYGDPTFASTYSQSMSRLQTFASRNTQSLAELLIGFFEFYAFQLDYRRLIVSIRTSDWLTKEQKAAEDSWKMHLRVGIEDPFETSYDVAHMLRDSGFNQIRNEFARAYAILTERSLDEDVCGIPDMMDALLTPPEPAAEDQ